MAGERASAVRAVIGEGARTVLGVRGAVGERKSAGGAQRGYGRCGGCAGDLCAGDVCTADAGADGRRDGCGANGSRRTQKQGCRMVALFAIYI